LYSDLGTAIGLTRSPALGQVERDRGLAVPQQQLRKQEQRELSIRMEIQKLHWLLEYLQKKLNTADTI